MDLENSSKKISALTGLKSFIKQLDCELEISIT